MLGVFKILLFFRIFQFTSRLKHEETILNNDNVIRLEKVKLITDLRADLLRCKLLQENNLIIYKDIGAIGDENLKIKVQQQLNILFVKDINTILEYIDHMCYMCIPSYESSSTFYMQIKKNYNIHVYNNFFKHYFMNEIEELIDFNDTVEIIILLTNDFVNNIIIALVDDEKTITKIESSNYHKEKNVFMKMIELNKTLQSNCNKYVNDLSKKVAEYVNNFLYELIKFNTEVNKIIKDKSKKENLKNLHYKLRKLNLQDKIETILAVNKTKNSTYLLNLINILNKKLEPTTLDRYINDINSFETLFNTILASGILILLETKPTEVN